MVEEPDPQLRHLVRLTIDTWHLLLPAACADPGLSWAAADESRNWDAARRRLSAARDHIAAQLDELDEAEIQCRIEESGAPPDVLARFLTGVTAGGGLKALLVREPGPAFLLDESAPCYLGLGLVALGVLVTPKMPLLGGFAIGFGATEAAATC